MLYFTHSRCCSLPSYMPASFHYSPTQLECHSSPILHFLLSRVSILYLTQTHVIFYPVFALSHRSLYVMPYSTWVLFLTQYVFTSCLTHHRRPVISYPALMLFLTQAICYTLPSIRVIHCPCFMLFITQPRCYTSHHILPYTQPISYSSPSLDVIHYPGPRQRSSANRSIAINDVLSSSFVT